jgi:hypothetical protein
MVTIQNTINSSTPGLDLYNAMATAMGTIGASLVDTQVISTRTHKVWKFPAAINAAGKDWYLDITYVTGGGGNLTMLPMEFYDPATHLAYRMPISQSSSTVDAATSSFTGSTGGTLESAQSGATAATLAAGRIGVLDLTTSSFGYWIDITGDRIAAISSNRASNILYVGMYTPTTAYAAKAGAALFPLVVIQMYASGVPAGGPSSGANSANVAITRMPPATTIAQMPGGNWFTGPGWQTVGPMGGAMPRIPGGSTTFSDLAVIPCGLYGSTSDGTGSMGTFGTLIGVGACPCDSSVTVGSTVTISGVDWILTTQLGNGALLFKTS